MGIARNLSWRGHSWEPKFEVKSQKRREVPGDQLGVWESAVSSSNGVLGTALTSNLDALRAQKMRYIPTADQINSTVPITKIPRPSFTDQALHDLFPTKSACVWSNNDQVLVK